MWKSVACLIVTLAACVPPPGSSLWGAPAGSAEPGSPATAATTTDSACVGAVRCLAGCAADPTCFQACIDLVDPVERGPLDALLACNAAGGTCEAELAGCRGDGSVAVGPTAPSLPGQPVANADILPWLVGAWIGTNHQFVFTADGQVRRSAGGAMIEDHAGTTDDRHCVAVSNDLGTVRQEGDVLIMEFAGSASTTCGIREAAGPSVVRYRITWFDNAYDDTADLQLVLVDLDCTAGPMWCNDAMKRR